jgi:hypothetical protein
MITNPTLSVLLLVGSIVLWAICKIFPWIVGPFNLWNCYIDDAFYDWGQL